MPLHRYQPFYCEENIWHLCHDPSLCSAPKRVVFISNACGAVVLFAQRAAPRGAPMAWDYHVVLVARAGPSWDVWDLDTRLGLPVGAERYVYETFERARVPAVFAPRFRVVDAEEFVATFASDRSHMRKRSGAYRRPPPPWAPIGAGASSNLAQFVDMERPGPGDVLDLRAFRDAFVTG